MKASNSGKSSSMSTNKSSKARCAFHRSPAASKIFWKRTRNACSSRNRGNLPNSTSSCCSSSFVSSCGLRRNSHIKERNSFRSAFESFALYARVIFFSLGVDRFIELLGYVETVHHRLGVGQQAPTGVVERLRHVGPVRLH